MVRAPPASTLKTLQIGSSDATESKCWSRREAYQPESAAMRRAARRAIVPCASSDVRRRRVCSGCDEARTQSETAVNSFSIRAAKISGATDIGNRPETDTIGDRVGRRVSLPDVDEAILLLQGKSPEVLTQNRGWEFGTAGWTRTTGLLIHSQAL